MSEIHIPLVRGENAAADTKLLPDGALSLAQNVRFKKDARIVSRPGYRFITDAPVTKAFASVAWDTDRTLLFYERDAAPSTFREMLPGETYTDAVTSSAGTTLEAPIRRVAAQRARYTIVANDCAYAGGYLLCVYNDNDVDLTGGDGALHYVVYEQSTMRMVASSTIVDYSENLMVSYFHPKCIALGTDIFIVYRKDQQMRMTVFHTADLTDDDYALGVYTLAASGEPDDHQRSFDICPYDSTRIALALEYINGTTSEGIRVYTVDATGNVVQFVSTTGFGTQQKRVGICRVSNGTYTERYLVSAVDAAGLVRMAAYSTAGAVVTAITTIDNSGNARGAPCSGTSTLHGGIISWALAPASDPAGKAVVWKYHGLSGTTIPSVWPVTKPFTSPDGGDMIWTVDRTERDNIEEFGTYKLVDCAISDVQGGGVVCDAVCAQEQALCGSAYRDGVNLSQLRHVVTVEIDEAKNENAAITTLPILVGASGFMPSRADFVEIRFGTFVESCHTARLNGQLFISGARLREFDGSQLYESGLAQGPGAVNISTQAGSISAGTRIYKIIWKWIDAAGRIHRSQPATSHVATVSSTTNTITVEPPLCSARTANGRVTIFAEIYRTINNGTQYFLVNPNVRPTYHSGLLSPLTYDDDATDDAISANEQIYTEGDVLENEEPPPCCFLAAGEDRLLMAGLEDRSAYRFSRRAVPGLALTFTTDPAFGGTVDGDITGVGFLDGVFYVGTREAIYAITGDGPDDLGDGQFTRPRRLPSDCGFMSQRSIVETPQGLLFQGSNGRIYLLPRGGGAPQWIGQAVRDVTDAYPLITWAKFIPEQNIVVISCNTRTVSSTDAIWLVLDTRIGEWVRDVWLPSAAGHTRATLCAAVREGRLLINGNIEETGYNDSSDGDAQNAIEMTLITGDIRPFGPEGDGRVRSVTVLGERGTDADVTIDVSRDSGASWDTPAGSWTALDFTDVRYDLPRVRGTGFRFRIRCSPNVEGLIAPGQNAIINALTLEIFPAAGAKRLGSGQKR